MTNLHYHLAAEGDIAFISETYDENMDALHGMPRTYDCWAELMADKNTIYYIVYADVPVAWFRIDLETDSLWLGMLQVKPAHQRKGIGRYVLSVVEDMAKEKGLSKIGIHTTEDNAAARALYASAGYTVTEIGPCTTADGTYRTYAHRASAEPGAGDRRRNPLVDTVDCWYRLPIRWLCRWILRQRFHQKEISKMVSYPGDHFLCCCDTNN